MTVNLHEASKPINLRRGVRHGDTMSPKLLITVLEPHVQKNQLEFILTVRNNHLRFAEDIVLTTEDLGEAKQMLYELEGARSEVGLKINFSKIKKMTNIVMSEMINIINR